MRTILTEQPDAGVIVVDAEHDRWVRTGDRWHCIGISTNPRTWEELESEFGPLILAFPQEGGVDEAREFEVRRTALLAAATIVGGNPDGYEPGHEARDVTGLARKFEPYLRGEAR